MNRPRISSGYRSAILVALLGLLANRAQSDEPSQRLRIAFASNRDKYFYPQIYFYDHDGISQGKIVGGLDGQDKRFDHQPALSADGHWCAYGSEPEAVVGSLQLWDTTAKKAMPIAELNAPQKALFSPSLSHDGEWLAFTAWGWPGTGSRWNVMLWNVTEKRMAELPGLNTTSDDERRAAISADGRWIVYTSNGSGGRGLTDIRLYDRQEKSIDNLLVMNTPALENYPCISADGRWIAFVSDREGGAGGMDIYLYDRIDAKYAALTGLNSPGHEQTPALTVDTRYLAFVSERFNSAGEHDIFIYDRTAGRLLDTPNLNSVRDDYDPSIILVP